MSLHTEVFIHKAKTVHGNKYDYSKVEYVGSKDKVKIICPLHGEFRQTPHIHHIQESGCPKCAAEERGRKYALTTDQFVTKAKAVHGDKYDYSKVVYKDTKSKVEIICPTHGVFWQQPREHLAGRNCQACAKAVTGEKFRSTSDEFISKAKSIHGDRYGYTHVDYLNNHTKIQITCSTHGGFWQTPNAHLLGQGCPACGGRLKLTTDQFVAKAKEVHGDRYDYSGSVYVTAKDPVKIICKTHGEFWQIPNNHTQGAGCSLCVPRIIENTEEFIRRAKLTHGDRYKYDKSVYVDGCGKLIIVCGRHGDFEQSSSEHIRGKGCPKCAAEHRGDLARYTEKDFLQKARLVHGDKYDYSGVEYIDLRTKINITCKKHGIFQQKPINHLRGSGCLTCKSSKGELIIAKVLCDKSIDYVQEYSLPETSDRYRYDFYLPELGLLIEYHGVQHYKPIEFFGGEDQLRATQLRDKIKRSVAKALGYQYLEIGYKEFLTFSEEEFEVRFMDLLNKFKARFMAKKSIRCRPQVS